MVNRELLDWINQYKANGYSPDQLKSSLLQQGYPPQEVNQAINMSFSQKNTNNSPKKHKKMKPIWIVLIVLGALFIVIGVPIAFITLTWFNAKDTFEIQETQEQTQGNQEDFNCFELDIRPTKAVETTEGTYFVTIERFPGGPDEIGGVKLYFTSDNGISYVEDYPQNVRELETTTLSPKGVINFKVSNVEIIPYFLDNSNNEILCNNKIFNCYFNNNK